MSGTPINLNKVRKARARAAAKTRAETNVMVHGRSKVQKETDGLESARLRRELDGKALKSTDDVTGQGSKKP
ncbi:MAG: DUF4169 family protein [Tateyamaria sp.]|uniref:DUF4169 family protein n=1 Tax=Tateyamaria sp. TaxID=1929288 RepID=UPI00326DC6D0